MKLRYFGTAQEPLKTTTAPSYTGNITEWQWQHKGSSGGTDDPINTYAFTYDRLSRLVDTDHYTGTATTPVNSFTERGITYDRNGNIKTLQRYGATAGTIDDDFAYAYDGNKLTSLQTATGTKQYAYDSNGNCTSDGLNALNLGYNFLNLVGNVKVGAQTVSDYRWLADGTTAGVKGYNNGSLSSGFEYLGSLVYQRNANNELQLESASFGGGRFKVQETGSGPEYKPNYFLTDHLGSTRAVVSQTGQVLDRSDYYPYGLKWEHPGAQASTNRWLYNGKELQVAGLPSGVNYLDYGARIYIPRLGRWHSIDPLAEIYYSSTPFNYVDNDPISQIDPNGTFKTRFGAWFYKLFNGGDGVYKDRGGEYFVSKTTTGSNEEGDITVSAKRTFDRKGRTEGHDLEALAIHKAWVDRELQRLEYEKHGIEYKISHDPYEIWSNSLSNAAFGVMPAATFKGIAWASSSTKTSNATTNVIKTTKHGSTRIAGAAATRGGVLSRAEITAVKNIGQKLTQADGASVFLHEISPGKFNIVVEGNKGLITSFKNVSQKSVQRLSKNYGWN